MFATRFNIIAQINAYKLLSIGITNISFNVPYIYYIILNITNIYSYMTKQNNHVHLNCLK